jgi:hypothetical protein
VNTGRVVGLAAQASKAAPAQSVPSLGLLAGAGIFGEVHADRRSPRQLLLAGASVYDDFNLPPHALGENLLLETDTACLGSGTVLQIGDLVRLRLMFQCEACGQLDVVQPRLATRIGNRRGMLARVLTGGAIRAGDLVRDLGVLEQPWPDDWRERVRRVLDAAPDGHVVEYPVLARLAGIPSSYCRAFPRLLARLGAHYAARAVSAQSAAGLPRWQGDGLFERY